MLDKKRKDNVQITSQTYIENFVHTLCCSCYVALISLMQQIYYSAEQVNKERELRENQDQIQLTFTILIEKLHSSFFHTKPFDAWW